MKPLAELLPLDRCAVWHPYSALHSDAPVYPVVSASGTRLILEDGRELIDGMASWWCAIHGYRHPVLDAAAQVQLGEMAHVMFGGLTHRPALALTEQLLALTPEPLQAVFYSDSGSVAVEVAMKMALQYWQGRGVAGRHRFLSLRSAYHGDTLGAMSVCDPVTGMHRLFAGFLPEQYFVTRPACRFGSGCTEADIAPLQDAMRRYHSELTALIMEPVVQGAGGMWFYDPEYLVAARALCDEYEVLLIFDEIATGFARTGRFFALEHAGVCPDILCLGKALTGGYTGLAATLTTQMVHECIDAAPPHAFMHGPTFMANPLACRVACASIELLLASPWQENIQRIERGLQRGLEPCRVLSGVSDVRVLGAIGVVELAAPVQHSALVEGFVARGVWIRPFGPLVYLMPPYLISDAELNTLCTAVFDGLSQML